MKKIVLLALYYITFSHSTLSFSMHNQSPTVLTGNPSHEELLGHVPTSQSKLSKFWKNVQNTYGLKFGLNTREFCNALANTALTTIAIREILTTPRALYHHCRKIRQHTQDASKTFAHLEHIGLIALRDTALIWACIFKCVYARACMRKTIHKKQTGHRDA